MNNNSAKQNKLGQSLIEIVFSIGIVILVLTGVAILTVKTNNARMISLERKKAIDLSQKLIENKILEIKTDSSDFWNGIDREDKNDQLYPNFDGYLYDVEYKNCDSDSCNVVFTIKWGNNQSLSVERFFSKTGT